MIDDPKPDQVLLDVRTMKEVKNGVIPGAIHLDYNDKSFEKNLGLLDRDRTYYVYCHAGVRSAAAAKLMDDMGFEFVYDLEGGISEWQSEGLPVTAISQQ